MLTIKATPLAIQIHALAILVHARALISRFRAVVRFTSRLKPSCSFLYFTSNYTDYVVSYYIMFDIIAN